MDSIRTKRFVHHGSLILAAACVTLAFAGLSTSSVAAKLSAVAATKHSVPVLGHAFIESKGYGHPHPKHLSSGPTARTFEVRQIKWKHWGRKKTAGIGVGWHVPRNQPIGDGNYAKEKIVAFDLGKCQGKLAYTKMRWWFPKYGGSFRKSPTNDLCV
jgi:hypothetical protein